ncbi:uncharacterized protein METZ01_LOCUS259475, partial [marine metagenome]
MNPETFDNLAILILGLSKAKQIDS